jgi:hypothetical protein
MSTADVKFVYQADISNVLKANRVMTKDVDATMSAIGRSMARQVKFQNQMDYGLTKLSKELKGVTVPFAGYAMSIMFFGMALQKTFSAVTKFGTKAFQDIQHSVIGTVTQTDMLEGSMKFLGYTIGQALEPMVSYLIPIIDNISDWVDKNPELTSGIVGIGIALGAIFAIGGSGILALNGFKELKTILTGTDWSTIGSNITKGIGIIAIGYAFKQSVDAYKDFKEGAYIEGLINAMSAGSLAYGGIKILKGQKGGGYLIAIGVALELVEKGVFFQTLFGLMGQVGGIIAGGVAEAMYQVGRIVEQMWNNSMFSDIFGKMNISGDLPRFEDIYGTVVAGMSKIGRDWDTSLQSSVDRGNRMMSPTEPIQGQQAVLYANNVYINGDTAEDIYKGLLSQVPGSSSAFR